MISRKQLIKKYIDFFKSKDHKVILNASLIPENDPTALFISAGMHPLVPFLLGQPHPSGKRLCNVQKCVRTTDIEEVGDNCHHTFFEQLGNWSLGEYGKKQAIEYTFEFLTKVLKIPKKKLAASVFKGDKDAPEDEESYNALISVGFPKERIAILPKSENWWGPAGKTGPCGPDSEIFYWIKKIAAPKKFNPNDENWMEVGNNVFIEYNKDKKGKYSPLTQKNVDFGGGSERMLAILEGHNDDYLTSAFKPIIKKIEKILPEKIEGTSNYEVSNNERKKSMRIIADHIKAAVFIISDGIVPSNTEQGYVLRRLIRRAIRHARILQIKNSFVKQIAEPIFEIYDDYPELKRNKIKILNFLRVEEEKFEKTLNKGLKYTQKIRNNLMHRGLKTVLGKEIFLLYQSYGFPIEMIKEEFNRWNIKVDEKGFEKEQKKHQKLSRTVSAGKFKSGLADDSKATTKLHTTAHLLLAALRIVLKDKNIIQKGSNITPERLRLDFSFPRKLTKEELKEIEDLVNEQIKESHEVIRKEMSPGQAKKEGALGIFDQKYGDKISIYTIDDFSKEICAGPHVKNTCELGNFKIKKEESSSAGVRRVKATLE